LNKIFNYEKNKEWKFEGEKPCIIDFYADWCGPCKVVAPVLEELSKDYDGKINVFKVDTESRTGACIGFWYKKHSFIFICSC